MAEAAEERVKPCLECGTIVPFDAEVCSLCGSRAGGSADEEAVKPCLACEALIAEDDLFCPECGDFALRVDVDRGMQPRPRIGAQEGGAAQVLSRVLAVVVALGAVVLLVGDAWDWARLRGLDVLAGY